MSQPEEERRSHAAYLEASKVLQAALAAKHERHGEPPPQFPTEPFRRWTPRAGAR